MAVLADGGGFSWRLGDSIVNELNNINRELGLLNVFGNVAMFVPLGWLATLLVRRRGFVVGALLTCTGFEDLADRMGVIAGQEGCGRRR